MNQLEKLLNTLLEMGWKPWGNDADSIRVITETILYITYKNGNGGELQGIRKLVSIDSQLWQFVVNKGIFDRNMGLWTDHFTGMEYDNYYYVYRLLESALVPEEDLVEFLLGNIILEEGKGKN